ncbi:AHH domain-containing protein, partial [Cytobacillus firmus]
VMQKVSDIVSLPHLQDGEFSAHVRRAELHRRNTVDDLMTFDSQQTLALDPIEQDLHLMQTYIDEISSLFQSGNLSISGYSVKQLQSSPIYGELLEGIRHKAGNSVRSPEFFKELGVTALGQILPPGAYSIWAIWQSNYERNTIHYQLRALKALAELNSNEISPEEFASLSGREILTVDVIDEYGIGSENQGGKFHLYEDGRIVREFYGEKGKAYEFVDSIPKDRVGGVRELDSIADGTPLEILEYLSLAAVVRKQGTKVIRKSIKKADFDALVRILKEEKGNVVLPGKKAGKGTGNANRLIPGTPGKPTTGDPTKLGKNLLESMGIPRSTSWKGYQAQHIIPSQLNKHPVIKKIGMEMNDSTNGIFLPIPFEDVSGLSRHRGFHSVYNNGVRKQLDKMDVNQDTAVLEKQVYELQQRLKKGVENGLPLYKTKINNIEEFYKSGKNNELPVWNRGGGATEELWERWLSK